MAEKKNNVFMELLCGKWFPVLLILVMLCAYATQIPELGFYLDDWVSIVAYDQGGEEGLVTFGINDSRPFAAWVTAKFFNVLGTGVLQWQLITLFWRFAAAVASFFLLKSVWPEHKLSAGLISLLFGVFPFFKHQPICIAYFMILMQYFTILLSFLLTVKALQTNNKGLKLVLFALSYLTSLFHLACLEYYLSLEAARLLLIFFVLQKRDGTSFWKTAGRALLVYVPYILILLFILGYRFIYIPSLSQDIRRIDLLERFNGIDFLLHLAGMTIQYLSESLLGVWYRSINPSMMDLTVRHAQLGMGLGLIAAAAVFFLLFRARKTEDAPEGKTYWEMLILGLFAMLLGYLPGMMINASPSSTATYHDRYLIPSFWGIAVFTIIWMMMVFKKRPVFELIYAGMIILCVYFQIENAFGYRYSWKYQQQFQWQMKWRIPDIEENTAVLSDEVVALYMGGWADGSMLNEMYGKKKGFSPTPYWYFNRGEENYYGGIWTGEPLYIKTRMYEFEAGPEDVIIITKPEYGKCAWLLDEADRYNPYLTEGMHDFVPYQNKSRIRLESDHVLPPAIFGTDYIHDWCYYFEKADLALDREDYAEVLSLYDEASAHGYTMGNATEMRPFIKAAAFSGEWEKALEWTEAANAVRPDQTSAYFENLWEIIERDAPGSAGKSEALEKVRNIF